MCDYDSRSVSVVSVTDDTVTARLSKPDEVRDEKPEKIAVLGDSVLVLYGRDNLVVYENGVSSSGTMVTWPGWLGHVCGMSSDGVSRFLFCERSSNAVFTLDVSRNLCEKIKIPTDRPVRDCTMVDGKLWVGRWHGDILVMSPQ